MKAVILSAGQGKRLAPLTLTRPKHLLPVGGRPILGYTLAALSPHVDEITVVVGYKQEMIREYLKRWEEEVHHSITLRCVTQKTLDGTASALAETDYDEFICVNGDVFFEKQLVDALVNLYREYGKSLLSAARVSNPEHYGVVSISGEGEEVSPLGKIVEKPVKPGSNLVNIGVYIFTGSIYKHIQEVCVSARGEFELTDAIQRLGREEDVLVYEYKGYWKDVGRPWDLLDLNRYVLGRMRDSVIGGFVDGKAVVVPPLVIGQGTTIKPGAYVEGPVVIGDDCEIGPNCYIRPYTSIGDDVKVGNAVEIKNSILFSHTRVAHLSYVGDSIIGECCNLGAGTITANLRHDGRNIKMSVEGRLVDSGERKLGVVMGDNCKTGVGTMLYPGRKLGPNSWTNVGTIVRRDIPPNSILHEDGTIERIT
ncbi:MAG: glucose-1-phosphate thymidylyltransferase [Methanobacteriota archaeon]|nr:MAG: glucose-1-phosphate thymidylyltransferase [Euryarchaeota archaeon]